MILTDIRNRKDISVENVVSKVIIKQYFIGWRGFLVSTNGRTKFEFGGSKVGIIKILYWIFVWKIYFKDAIKQREW